MHIWSFVAGGVAAYMLLFVVAAVRVVRRSRALGSDDVAHTKENVITKLSTEGASRAH